MSECYRQPMVNPFWQAAKRVLGKLDRMQYVRRRWALRVVTQSGKYDIRKAVFCVDDMNTNADSIIAMISNSKGGSIEGEVRIWQFQKSERSNRFTTGNETSSRGKGRERSGSSSLEYDT